MASWRDNVSEQAQNDIDHLYDHGLEFAAKFLNKDKNFIPFAFTLSNDEKITIVSAYPETQLSKDIISDIIKGLTSDRKNIKAAVIVSDVRITGGSDAVRIFAEHKEGLSVEFILPYVIKGLLLKKVVPVMENAFAQPAERMIWI